jgi:ankyrin repeat protein
VEIVKLLLQEPGIEVNIINARGKMPLQLAIEFLQVAMMLIRNEQTDVNVRNADGATALHCFVERASHECVQICRRDDMDVNVAQLGDGVTP